jgi:hypothetical protein
MMNASSGRVRLDFLDNREILRFWGISKARVAENVKEEVRKRRPLIVSWFDPAVFIDWGKVR